MHDSLSQVDLAKPDNLVHALQQHAFSNPDAIAFRYLDSAGNETIAVTYSELLVACERLGASIQNRGLFNKRIIILLPNEPDFVFAFLGCVCAGAISIPIEPTRKANTIDRLQGVISDAQPAVIISSEATLQSVFPETKVDGEPAPRMFCGVPILDVDSLKDEGPQNADSRSYRPSRISHLQYTSGSTSQPKGVVVTHENVISNCRDIANVAGMNQQHVVVGWVPFTHDMGLVGMLCLPVLMGFPFVFMRPSTFVMRPHLWLESISKYHGTISAAPNFAFALCTQRISATRRENLNLSSLVALFNGAERVDAETVDRFCQTFAACGFSSHSLLPCYGMAECTLIVTSRRPKEELVFKSLDKDVNDQGQGGAAPRDLGLVSCGRTTASTEIAIVNPDGSEAIPGGEIGEICVHGASVTPGYLNDRWETDTKPHDTKPHDTKPHDTKPHDTKVLLGGKYYFRTGDLGFVHNGELFITGRQKDMIILAGRNIFPDDIEKVVETSHDGIRRGRSIAFSTCVDGEERLVVVAELNTKAQKTGQGEIENAMRIAIAKKAQVALYEVWLVRSGELPRTLSGKKQRQKCAAMYSKHQDPTHSNR